MDDLFNGFYDLPDSELKKIWTKPETLFVFDTNVLLNLYGYAEKTRSDFFNLIEKSILEQIWLPYHVGLEYQRNRLNVIRNEKKVFADIHNYLEAIEKSVKLDKINHLKLEQRLPIIKDKTIELHENIFKEIENYKKEVESQNKKQPDVRSTDKIRKKIDKLFNKKMGNKPKNQAWLNKIYEDGKTRYENKTPPGYMDKKEKENEENYTYSALTYTPMYGDLIVWEQIIEKAMEESIKSVVFITDDSKEDWRFSINSNGNKLMGARAELREEICRRSNINNFAILTSFEFLDKGKDISAVEIDKDSISEIEKLFNKRSEKQKEINKINELAQQKLELQNKYNRLKELGINISGIDTFDNHTALESTSYLGDSILDTSIYDDYLEQLDYLNPNSHLIDTSINIDSSLLDITPSIPGYTPYKDLNLEKIKRNQRRIERELKRLKKLQSENDKST